MGSTKTVRKSQTWALANNLISHVFCGESRVFNSEWRGYRNCRKRDAQGANRANLDMQFTSPRLNMIKSDQVNIVVNRELNIVGLPGPTPGIVSKLPEK